MGVVTGIVIFTITWVIILLMVLPWGVSHAKGTPKGADPGAPDNPHLRVKLYITTILSAIVWLFIDWWVE